MSGAIKAVGEVVSAPFKVAKNLISAPIDLITGHPGEALHDVVGAVTQPFKSIANAGKDILGDPLTMGIIGAVAGSLLLPGVGTALGFSLGAGGGALIGGGLGFLTGSQFQKEFMLSDLRHQQDESTQQLLALLGTSGGNGVGGPNTSALLSGLGSGSNLGGANLLGLLGNNGGTGALSPQVLALLNGAPSMDTNSLNAQLLALAR